LSWACPAFSFNNPTSRIGVDEGGRDVLSYLEGEVPCDLSWHEDAVLVTAAGLIRRYHDATTDLLPSPMGRKIGGEVICHNELSPCNFVFRSRLPVAMIDFDAAAPGTRAYDLGYAAWLWLDLGTPDTSAAERRRRLSVFLDAYGSDGPSRVEVIAAIFVIFHGIGTPLRG
jgi:Ser/Thr protein kinase RdoA (MazF antagonist)